MRVLLIEDEPTTAKAIELMLTNEGFNVYTTDLGEEGLDLRGFHGAQCKAGQRVTGV
jgi:DNA-binding response OmpR family regulator